MSRKRKKAPEVQATSSSSVDRESDVAVVEEEILAEGSGPIVSDEILAEAAAAAADADHDAHAEPILIAEDVGETESPELVEVSDDTAMSASALDATGDELDAGEEEGADAEGGEGATLPTAAAGMDAAELKQLVEALVFASDKPVTVQRLRQLTRVADTKRLEATLVELQGDYANRGLILTSVSGGWQFRTQPRFSTWVQQLIAGRPVRLSRAQLETLAIVAYRQPITRPEIDDIRGVDSSATLKLLLDRQLIRVLGKKEEVGRPMLYGTTKEFLDFFSLGDLRELPTLREYSELTDESRRVMTDRLGLDPEAEPAATTDSPLTEAGDAADAIDEMHASEGAIEATDAAVDAVAEAVDAVSDAVDAVEDAAEAIAAEAADASEHVRDAAASDAGEHAHHVDEVIEAATHAADDAVHAADDAVDIATHAADDAIEAATHEAATGEVDEETPYEATTGEPREETSYEAVTGEGTEVAIDEADRELDAPSAHTLSSLAERILAEDAAREHAPRIDVDAMPGVRADADDVAVTGSQISITDEIIDSDEDADANESE